MDAQTCILTRRSVRKFTQEPVDHALLEQVISLAAYAPSWKNTQISRYIAIEDPAVQQAIIEAGHETTVEMRALLDKQESASREFLKEKGMVFCGVPTDEDEWMKRAVSIWPQFYPQIKNLEIVEAFMKTLGRQLPR